MTVSTRLDIVKQRKFHGLQDSELCEVIRAALTLELTIELTTEHRKNGGATYFLTVATPWEERKDDEAGGKS